MSSASLRGDPSLHAGLGASKQQSHRRADSAAAGDDFHKGFVKRLVGILDDHGKTIKNNADFLKDISSTLRNHSYSRLPRPVSEPVLRMPTANVNVNNNTMQSDDIAVESSPGTPPPTPPDTPSVEVTDWSYPPDKSEHKPTMVQPQSPKVSSKADKPTLASTNKPVADSDIAQWYLYHADRAAKSLRYDCREVDMKLARFIRKLNDLRAELDMLNQDKPTITPSNSLAPLSNQSHRRTKSTPTMQGTDAAIRKQLEIKDAVQQEYDSIRQTLRYYRKERATTLELVTKKADLAMPGYSALDAASKQRALHDYYRRNKDISKPGDRARYNDAVLLVHACIAKPLNEEFVTKIDTWENNVAALKGEYPNSRIL